MENGLKKMFTKLCWLFLLVGFCGCGGVKLESSWREQKITVDGRDGEWGDKYFFDKEGAILGLANDDEHMYLFLSTTDRALQMKLLRQGFTVSFDPKGGKKSKFGVRYPLGLNEEDLWLLMERLRGGEQLRPRRPGQRVGSQINPQMLESMYTTVMGVGQLEILGGSAHKKQLLSLASVPEIEVALSFAEKRLVYELKVPLARIDRGEYQVGIGIAEGGTVGVGLLTPELDMRALRQQRRERDPRVGGVGGADPYQRGGGYGGYGRRQGVGVFGEVLQSLQLWTKVELADR